MLSSRVGGLDLSSSEGWYRGEGGAREGSSPGEQSWRLRRGGLRLPVSVSGGGGSGRRRPE